MSTSTAVIGPGAEGDGIEAAIRREHEAASSAARTALDHALECGRLLAQAREGIAHGGWESFVRERCGIPERTARMYLRLDANRERLANRQHVAGLTVREAVRELTVPRVKAEPEAEPPAATAAFNENDELSKKLNTAATAEAEGTVDAEVGMNPKLAQVLATLTEAESPVSMLRTIAAEYPDMGHECGQSLTDWIAQHDETSAALRRKVQRWWTVPAWYRPDSLIVAAHEPTKSWVEVWPHPRSPRRVHVIVHVRSGDEWTHFELPPEGIRRDEVQHFLEAAEDEGLPWMDRGSWTFTYEPMSAERTAQYRPYLVPRKPRRKARQGAPA